MIVFRVPYSGERNFSRRIGEVERLRDSIHYKDEQSMLFSSYPGKVQNMFNVFADQKEPYKEDMKLRFIFRKVHHPSLLAAFEDIKVRESISQRELTAQVSVLPEFVVKGWGISTIKRGGGNNSIYKSDGTIYTGFIKN